MAILLDTPRQPMLCPQPPFPQQTNLTGHQKHKKRLLKIVILTLSQRIAQNFSWEFFKTFCLTKYRFCQNPPPFIKANKNSVSRETNMRILKRGMFHVKQPTFCGLMTVCFVVF